MNLSRNKKEVTRAHTAFKQSQPQLQSALQSQFLSASVDVKLLNLSEEKQKNRASSQNKFEFLKSQLTTGNCFHRPQLYKRSAEDTKRIAENRSHAKKPRNSDLSTQVDALVRGNITTHLPVYNKQVCQTPVNCSSLRTSQLYVVKPLQSAQNIDFSCLLDSNFSASTEFIGEQCIVEMEKDKVPIPQLTPLRQSPVKNIFEQFRTKQQYSHKQRSQAEIQEQQLQAQIAALSTYNPHENATDVQGKPLEESNSSQTPFKGEEYTLVHNTIGSSHSLIVRVDQQFSLDHEKKMLAIDIYDKNLRKGMNYDPLFEAEIDSDDAKFETNQIKAGLTIEDTVAQTQKASELKLKVVKFHQAKKNQ